MCRSLYWWRFFPTTKSVGRQFESRSISATALIRLATQIPNVYGIEGFTNEPAVLKFLKTNSDKLPALTGRVSSCQAIPEILKRSAGDFTVSL